MFNPTQRYAFTCKLVNNSPLSHDHVSWSVQLMHAVARWNRNTEWHRKILCVTDDQLEIFQHITPGQRDAYVRTPLAFKSLGVTWNCNLPKNALAAAIWLCRDQSMTSLIDTLAHELAHVVTKSAHGWCWRRMNIILTPLVRAHVYHDLSQLDYDHVEDVAKETMRHYRTIRLSGQHTNTLAQQIRTELDKHIAAATRAHIVFKQYVLTVPR